MQFALTEDQVAIRDMARSFAAEKIAPHALDWDERKHFPIDVMREAAALGIGGIYIGRHLYPRRCRRLRPVAPRRCRDLRGPFDGLPDGCGLYLDPQHVRLDDRPLWVGRAAAKVPAEALHHGASGELLPDRAGLRLRRGCVAHPCGARRRSLRPQRPEAVHLRCRRRRSLCGDGAHRR